jgi:hypothetical protein
VFAIRWTLFSSARGGPPADSQPEVRVTANDRGTAGRRPSRSQKRGWADRLRFAPGPDSFAYAPGDVIAATPGAAEEVGRRLFPDDSLESRRLPGVGGYELLSGVPEPRWLVTELRRLGVKAQPNHVFFTHSAGCGCCCPPHPSQTWGTAGGAVHGSPAYASPAYASPAYASPAYASPAYASPAYASPAYASPAYASPAYASPAYASPAYASPAQATGRRPSSARPAVEPWLSIALERCAAAAGASTQVPVVVLDTGLATSAFHSDALGSLLPLLDCPSRDGDQPDDDNDLDLDPAAGHGTFIAGLIQQIAPGTAIAMRRVLHAEGDGDEVQIAAAIDALPDVPDSGGILNLSFGGYVMEHPGLLASAVAGAQARGYVVVASAGNDATCRAQVPASLPDVVSVGAVGPHGPAPFTNYGDWVRACAPGVDLVSTFFAGWNGDEPPTGDGDADEYTGWACWSGTSFAAPVVVGALAREMARGFSAQDAVTRLIDNPALLRIPGLGTVVNVL